MLPRERQSAPSAPLVGKETEGRLLAAWRSRGHGGDPRSQAGSRPARVGAGGQRGGATTESPER